MVAGEFVREIGANEGIKDYKDIATHAAEVIQRADRVLVLEHGRIVEDGQPADLIAGDGQYAALHQAWLRSLA